MTQRQVAGLVLILIGFCAGAACGYMFGQRTQSTSHQSGPDRGGTSEKSAGLAETFVSLPPDPTGSAQAASQGRSSSQPDATHLQTVHQTIPIPIATLPAPVTMPAPMHNASAGTWTFKADDFVFTFDAQKPERSTVQRVQKYAVFVTLELSHRVKSTVIDQKLFRLDADNTVAEEMRDAKWQVVLLQRLQTREQFAAFEQSVGVGVSCAGLREWHPAIVYSPLRLGRIRPALLADTDGNVGPGAQLRLWRPFHAGAFATKRLSAWDDPLALRLAFTVNL